MSGLAFWAEDRWTRPFGYRPGPNEDNPYTLGYHIGQDVGGRSWFDPVPVLVSGMVVQSGRGALIGGYVVVRVSDGTFHTYCHLRTGSLPGYGTQLTAGDDLVPLARSASPYAGDDYMGSASDGAHCHFVVSTNPATAYSPRAGTVIDPRPIIRAALGGDTAGSSSRPFQKEGPFMALDDKQQDDLAMRVEAIANAVGDIGRGVALLLKRGGLDQQQENDIYMRVEAIANEVGEIGRAVESKPTS
ncbi:M23 family metallopeptidase [Microbacterium sp. PAMC21962]|uniref:M23 family metallopeptidase n=1 Tax=Microbacterium sp. PAMC21962 TaxID=2861280 RepID=UPI001C63AD92|nr:hypothetical protein [Microbacterium sp. PAMC21962]QYF98901.1 hypothetical protein KY498_06720 [Microbacterium sp. PAMC21962]